LADTIVLLNIPSEICVGNACKRAEENIKLGVNTDDMAEGFDYTVTEEFINYIKNFEKDTMPGIKDILTKYTNKNKRTLCNYREVEEFIDTLRKEYAE
jgi:adenylate kinase family enzyme